MAKSGDSQCILQTILMVGNQLCVAPFSGEIKIISNNTPFNECSERYYHFSKSRSDTSAGL